MTLQPHNHFHCNRCGDVAHVPIANNVPRNAPPEGWATIWTDNTSVEPQHLCPPCAFGLTAYLSGNAISPKPKGVLDE